MQNIVSYEGMVSKELVQLELPGFKVRNVQKREEDSVAEVSCSGREEVSSPDLREDKREDPLYDRYRGDWQWCGPGLGWRRR